MINYRILCDARSKNKVKNEFLHFFYNVYLKVLYENIWEHQFINSPYNDSPLFLAFDGEKIVGSALMIKQKLSIDDKIFDYYLFTTSAVDKEYRSKGIYLELLNMQKNYAKDTKKDFILAFPNKIAYNALKIFGGFKDISKDKIIKTNIDNINLSSFCNNILEDEKFIKWRFEHKDYSFIKLDNNILVVKKFEDSFDLLSTLKATNNFIPSNKFISFDELNSCYVLEKHTIDKSKNMMIDNYNATIFLINNEFNFNGKCINLLMSDVF